MSGVSKQANGRASGLVLTSRSMAVLNHSDTPPLTVRLKIPVPASDDTSTSFIKTNVIWIDKLGKELRRNTLDGITYNGNKGGLLGVDQSQTSATSAPT